MVVMQMDDLLGRVEINPKIMLGKPVIKGTRIPVELILKKLSQRISVEEILRDYPNLTFDDIRAAIAFASESLASDEIYLIG
jgi:uncharacterized protein (DUF433 family)